MPHIEPTSLAGASPDPQHDHPATAAPGNIAVLLHAARSVAAGHLIDTIHLAACSEPPISPKSSPTGNRGLLRAAALERVLVASFGGGNSIDRLMRTKARRREAFGRAQDRNPKANWDWLRLKRDDLRDVLGFFIGEPPINPLDPAAAIASAPP